MDIFSAGRQSRPYVPPSGGAGNATLLGRISDATAESVPDGQQIAQVSGNDELPRPIPGHQRDWRIELRYLPVADRGHAFLALVDPEGRTRRELHGLSYSRNRNDPEGRPLRLVLGSDGSWLGATNFKEGESPFGDARAESPELRGPTRIVSEVANGPYQDMVLGKWARGLQTMGEINRRNFDYKSYDPAYMVGGSGGQIQNSNSANYTFGQTMRLDLDSAIRRAGLERIFPGWNRNLLEPNYLRYVAPPVFPIANAP